MELSIILPCRNEEQSLDSCLKSIKETIKKYKINAEIIVSDSSTDKSPKIAEKHNIILVKHNKDGYGNAYLEAFKHTKGKYIFMADCDGTYDFGEIPHFINYLKKGYDFAIGDRFKGEMENGSMPFSHKYIGNPILSSILRLFFNAKIHDTHCGMRAISKEALSKLNLQTTGMEFASEMIIQAIKNKLKIKQIPINYYKRKGKSKLKPFIDGWRHLRFMLLYSPMFLFFIPGIFLFILGIISGILFYFGKFSFFGIKFFYHPLFLSSLALIIGYQLIIFSAFAKTYAITALNENSKIMNKLYKYLTIKNASLSGLFAMFIGIIIYISIFFKWINSNFGSLNEVKNSILASTLIILGAQTIFSSFMLSILGIKRK